MTLPFAHFASLLAVVSCAFVFCVYWQVYAQLLADTKSIAPTKSKVTDDDFDFEPARRPASTSAVRPRGLSLGQYARLAVDDDDRPSSSSSSLFGVGAVAADSRPQSAAAAPMSSSRERAMSWVDAASYTQEAIYESAGSEQLPPRDSGGGGLIWSARTDVSGPPTPQTWEAHGGLWPAAPPHDSMSVTSESLTTRSYGEVAARDNGTWGFAYPTKNSLKSTSPSSAAGDEARDAGEGGQAGGGSCRHAGRQAGNAQ